MENLDLLKKVQRVEAPEFLLTRIHAKIRATESKRLPASWQWAGATALGLLLFLNGFALNRTPATKIAPAEQLVLGLQMQTSNQLYDE